MAKIIDSDVCFCIQPLTLCSASVFIQAFQTHRGVHSLIVTNMGIYETIAIYCTLACIGVYAGLFFMA